MTPETVGVQRALKPGNKHFKLFRKPLSINLLHDFILKSRGFKKGKPVTYGAVSAFLVFRMSSEQKSIEQTSRRLPCSAREKLGKTTRWRDCRTKESNSQRDFTAYFISSYARLAFTTAEHKKASNALHC